MIVIQPHIARWRTCFLIGCLLAVVGGGNAAVHAQGTAADYARADGLQRRTRGKVFRDNLDVHWLKDPDRGWYRVKTGPGQSRFVRFDARNGSKQDAFDHARLAKALNAASDGRQSVTAESLPIASLEFAEDDQSLQFVALGKRWECRLADYALAPVKADDAVGESTVNVLPAIRGSRRNGGDSSIDFVNRTEGPIKLYWLPDEGSRTFYADVPAGEAHQQHTFAGHVWLATNAENRPIGVYEAVAQPGVAIIDGSWSPGRDGRSSNQRRRGSRRNNDGRSPDGRWEARIVDHNLVVTDLTSDEEFALSQDGTAEDRYLPRYAWSPDSNYLAVIQEEPGERREVTIVESSPPDQLQPRVQTYGYVKPGDRIDHPRPRLFHVGERRRIAVSEELFANPWSISELRWANDSSRFTFIYNQRGHQVLRVIAVDAETGNATPVIDEVSPTFVCYSSKLFYRPLDETSEIIWMSERDGWNHLYLYDAITGQVKNQITTGEWVVRNVERVDVERRQIWFTAGGIDPEQDPYYVHYARVDFDGTNLTLLTEGDGTHTIEYSPDERYFVDTYSRVDLPPVTELRRTDDGSLVCELERGEWDELLATDWQPPERFSAKGRDGKTDIFGVIFRPTNFDPEKKYPLIEKIYAGPQSAYVPKRFSAYHSAQSWAELGFIVVQIDGMGTSLRSKAFHDVCWRNLGDAGFPDRIAWMRAAAKTRPWMDLERVGIFGGSAGGQNAMRALIAHGDFYDAAAADCGCHDNRMDKIWWNEQWMGWPIGPWYEESSNVVQANRMQGKLLLMVGELDHNVDPASTMQVVNALIQADKDFDLLVIPGAGHGAGGGRYGTRRQRDFFVRCLWNVEPRR